jgi:hypothetical protein
MANDSYTWSNGPVVIILLRVLYIEAISERASRQQGALVFRVALGARILYVVGISAFLATYVYSVFVLHEGTWVYVVGAICITALCFGWPVTITVTDEAIYRRVWWRRRLRIPWDHVVGLEKAPGNEWCVYGKNGEIITFSCYHVDPSGFEGEVLKRANLRSATDERSMLSLDLEQPSPKARQRKHLFP